MEMGCVNTSSGACLFALIHAQDALYDYLKKRNIDDDLATFICMYADQKEQNEYTNWLDEMAKFVK